MSYPSYSRPERIADSAIHVIGFFMAGIAVAWLFARAPQELDARMLAALALYSFALLLMLGASGAYHILADTAARPVLRRVDHAAIYVKIAGTFTPLAVLLGTAFGYATLALVWLLALIGAAAKLWTGPGQMQTGFWPYLALGWLGLALFVPLTAQLPWAALGLMFAGGLLYSSGIWFYTWEALPYSNAIWHGFVLVASGCFFAGIVASASAL